MMGREWPMAHGDGLSQYFTMTGLKDPFQRALLPDAPHGFLGQTQRFVFGSSQCASDTISQPETLPPSGNIPILRRISMVS